MIRDVRSVAPSAVGSSSSDGAYFEYRSVQNGDDVFPPLLRFLLSGSQVIVQEAEGRVVEGETEKDCSLVTVLGVEARLDGGEIKILNPVTNRGLCEDARVELRADFGDQLGSAKLLAQDSSLQPASRP